MKLSEIKGERTFDVVADLAAPVSNIFSDPNVRKVLQSGKGKKDSFTNKFLRELLPVLMHDHKEDLLIILSTIEGVSVEEYEENLNIAKLILDFRELMTDEGFTDFLPQAKEQG